MIGFKTDRDYVLKAKDDNYLYKTCFYNTLEGIPVVDLEGFLEIYIFLYNDKPVYIYPNRKTPYVFTEKIKCNNTITAEDAVKKRYALDARTGELIFDYNTFADIKGIEY